MQLSKKQKQILDLTEDKSLIELLIGGSAGGSKTISMCLIMALVAKRYPGARFFVGRKTLKSLRQSTINTLISKVHPMLEMGDNEYTIHWQTGEIEYANGSLILFGEMETLPADPDFARMGSLEIDWAFVDEAGEITIQAKNAIKSRIGRGIISQKYGVPGKLILGANPSMNFLRQEYYDNYRKQGGGGFQKWQIGEVEIDGKMVPSYRGFLRMGAYDNPFLPRSYIDNLATLPNRERKRLLEGNWDYADDDDSLFRSDLLDKALCYESPIVGEKFSKFIGVDVAGQGGDLTVYSLIVNGVLTTQRVSSVQMNWDKKDERPLFRLMADELIEFAMKNGFTSKMARHIAVEGNGIGQALITCLKERGWQITEYTATHKSRSQNYYQLMLDMDSGETKIMNFLLGLDELRKELSVHSYEMVNQEPSVVKKEKIKQVLGRSPDRADSAMIANYVKHFIENPQSDPRRNKARLVY